MYRTVCYNAELHWFYHYTGCSKLSCIELVDEYEFCGFTRRSNRGFLIIWGVDLLY